MEFDPSKRNLTTADRLLLSRNQTEEQKKKPLKVIETTDYVGKLSHKQRPIFESMDKLMSSIYDDLSQTKNSGGWTHEEYVVAILDRSFAISEGIRNNLKLKTGDLPFNLRAVPAWLERPIDVNETQTSCLYDAILKIHTRVEAETKKMTLEEKTFYLEFNGLKSDEYELLAKILSEQMKKEEEDKVQTPRSTKFILQHIFASDEFFTEETFKNRQPVSVTPGAKYPEKRRQQALHKEYTKILFAFKAQTISSLQDDDEPTFESAVNFPKELSKLPGTEILLSRISPHHFSDEWLRALYAYYEETNDPIFKRLAESALERYKKNESPHFYKASEINSEIKTEVYSQETIDQINSKLQDLYKKLRSGESSPILVIDFDNTSTKIKLGETEIKTVKIYSMFGNISGHIEIDQNNDTKEGKRFSFALNSGSNLEELVVGIVDPEKVELGHKIALAKLITENIERELEQKAEDSPTEILAEIKPIVIPAGLFVPKGPSRVPSKDTKRPKIGFSELSPETRPETKRNLRPKLIVEDADFRQIRREFKPVIAALFENFVKNIYPPGGGIIKILKNSSTKDGEHILSARIARVYRAYFAVGENNQARLIEFFHKHDHGKMQTKYRS